MNGPPVNSKEADALITRVVERYVHERHYKVPTIHSVVKSSSSIMTQTDAVAGTEDTPETQHVAENEVADFVDSLEDVLMIPSENEDYLATHFDEEFSSSEDEDEE